MQTCTVKNMLGMFAAVSRHSMNSIDNFYVLATQNVTSITCGISPRVDYHYEPPMILFIILALISFLLRAAARFVMGVKPGWDDLCISLAMVYTSPTFIFI